MKKRLKFYLQSVSLCVYLCFNIFLVKCKLNRSHDPLRRIVVYMSHKSLAHGHIDCPINNKVTAFWTYGKDRPNYIWFLLVMQFLRKRYVLLNQKLLCSQKIVLTQSETVVLPEIRVDSIRNCCTPGQSC